VQGFLARQPDGGMHHLCYEVADLTEARDRLVASGVRIVAESPRGAHGKPVLFLHPKDCQGTLIELEQG
jgi:methylmalonyl-CoA/ethylmalonyl-CoA epimerase